MEEQNVCPTVQVRKGTDTRLCLIGQRQASPWLRAHHPRADITPHLERRYYGLWYIIPYHLNI